MAYGDVTHYSVEIQDNSYEEPFFWCTVLDYLGNVAGTGSGTSPDDALANAAALMRERESERQTT